MENQAITNPDDTSSINTTPVSQYPQSPPKKTNLIIPILITLFLSAALFGLGGYYVGRKSNQSTSFSPPKDLISSPSTVPTSTLTYSADSYLLQYPKNWKFSKYEDMYQDHTIFNNQEDNLEETSYEKPTDYIFGEMKVMTANEMRGEPWKELTEEEFFNPTSEFWLTGESIGGGSGFTQELPQKITIGEYLEGMEQTTYPSKVYERTYPEQITKYYYLYFGGTPTKILLISMTYDSRASGVQDSLKEFDTILSNFKLATN